jgi:HEAT repeat protein
VRRCAFLLAVLVGSTGSAKEPDPPFLILPTPDPATEKEIRNELVNQKALGDHVALERVRARERLAYLGPWTVPYLVEAVLKEKNNRVRMNAVLTLALIRDPRGLDALLAAAAGDSDRWVRRAAILALGTFRSEGTADALRRLLDDTKPGAPRSAAALALAKIRAPAAAEALPAKAENLPADEHEAAALLLAAAIARPVEGILERLASSKESRRLVHEAAATALTIRPLPAERAKELLAQLDRTRFDGTTRVMIIRALGAIQPRPDEVRAKLIDLARRDNPAAEERIAALLEFEGRAEEYDALKKAYSRIEGRNDPLVAVLLFAMARTREPAAFAEVEKVVRSGPDQMAYYAGASLLHVATFSAPPLDAMTRGRLTKPVRDRRSDWERLAAVADNVAVGRATISDFRKLDDPRSLHLFDLTPGERPWREVNRLFARIFELDKVLDAFDTARPYRVPESPFGGGGGGGGGETERKAPGGTTEEQDLFDILLPPAPPAPPEEHPDYFGKDGPPERPPYFGPEDLGAG